jgi:Ohr subfamily peroxiredoxin
LAAGYAACFHSTVLWLARQDGTPVTGSSVRAKVAIGAVDERLSLAVELIADLPGVEPAAAADLVERAHRTCPYSAATRGNVLVKIQLK